MLFVSSAMPYRQVRGAGVPALMALLVFSIILQHCVFLLASVVPDKRMGASGSNIGNSIVGPGQPEEIFTLDNRLESNYDEYPMVVPKRAALLLDRLMVALHHALEKERRKIGDFYDDSKSNSSKHLFNQQRLKNKNNSNSITQDYNYLGGEIPDGGGSLMYSDDDPNVVMDYDFKDLNSINRASGKTMANNLQRRDHEGILLEHENNFGDGLALIDAPTTVTNVGAKDAGYITAAITKLNEDTMMGDSRSNGRLKNIARMYWRCYFNAVSCF